MNEFQIQATTPLMVPRGCPIGWIFISSSYGLGSQVIELTPLKFHITHPPTHSPPQKF